MTTRRTIYRRRRAFWIMLAILVALLFRTAVENDGLRCAFMGIVILCWIGLYRSWVYGGLR